MPHDPQPDPPVGQCSLHTGDARSDGTWIDCHPRCLGADPTHKHTWQGGKCVAPDCPVYGDGWGFTAAAERELAEIIAAARLRGMVTGTVRFARAVLAAGYRRTADPSPEWELRDEFPDQPPAATDNAPKPNSLVHALRTGGESRCGGHHVLASFKPDRVTCPDCLADIAAASRQGGEAP